MDAKEAPAVAASHGEPRPATIDEDKYNLSIDDAIERYQAAGIPRTRRTVQRYCSNGTLDSHRFAIPYGEKYLITPESLERHIAYVLQGEAAMANRGEPRRGAAPELPITPGNLALQDNDDLRVGTSGHGKPRPSSESDTPTVVEGAEAVGILREENKFLKDQIAVKDAQIAVKDRQIADQSERVRETNLLVASLHKLITPLIGRGRPFDPASAPGGFEPDANDIHPPR